MRYYVIQCGFVSTERYATRAAAQAEADRLNAEADEDVSYEVFGDGAASVGEERVS